MVILLDDDYVVPTLCADPSLFNGTLYGVEKTYHDGIELEAVCIVEDGVSVYNYVSSEQWDYTCALQVSISQCKFFSTFALD